jgi:hypothetical protein
LDAFWARAIKRTLFCFIFLTTRFLKNRFKYIVLASILLCMSAQLFSQDVEMSQYFAAPLQLNPALAGISYGPRLTVNYRNQWAGLGDGFNGGYTT